MPREELIKEFYNDTGSKFWMYTSIVFLEKAKKFLDTKIKENALFEVRNSSIHYSAIYAEGAFITWAVNEYKNAGDLILSDNIRYSPIDLTLIEKTGKRIGFVIKYFNSSSPIALQHRLRNLADNINQATSESTIEFDSITIVFISASEENSLSIMRRFERPSSYYQEVLSENKILNYMVGYINENEFVKVSA